MVCALNFFFLVADSQPVGLRWPRSAASLPTASALPVRLEGSRPALEDGACFLITRKVRFNVLGPVDEQTLCERDCAPRKRADRTSKAQSSWVSGRSTGKMGASGIELNEGASI